MLPGYVQINSFYVRGFYRSVNDNEKGIKLKCMQGKKKQMKDALKVTRYTIHYVPKGNKVIVFISHS